ncbi:class I SAM-dependent methyltransferase [Mycobacterium marinum]|uniref:class I SAM-dependent methyltransferase n=1 Tax=Mycobacterium marinum TaxID=1781 RepID=UPI001FB5E5CD|nr:class I SAM-dependent methyltransferase [Mycobacterium marinum]
MHEIGADSGAMAAEVLLAQPDTRITATDYDAMVAAAAQRLVPFDARATARQGDATAVPFDDNTFDTVLTSIMVHHTVNREQVIPRSGPGGTLIGYDLLSSWPTPPCTALKAQRADSSGAANSNQYYTSSPSDPCGCGKIGSWSGSPRRNRPSAACRRAGLPARRPRRPDTSAADLRH